MPAAYAGSLESREGHLHLERMCSYWYNEARYWKAVAEARAPDAPGESLEKRLSGAPGRL